MDVLAIGSVLAGSLVGGYYLSKSLNRGREGSLLLGALELQGAVLVLALLAGGWSRSAWMCRSERRRQEDALTSASSARRRTKVRPNVSRGAEGGGVLSLPQGSYGGSSPKNSQPSESGQGRRGTGGHCEQREVDEGSSEKFEETSSDVETPWPSVSVVIPVKGCGSHSRTNWSSILDLEYPGASPQFFFVVEDTEDPACDLIASVVNSGAVSTATSSRSLAVIHVTSDNVDSSGTPDILGSSAGSDDEVDEGKTAPLFQSEKSCASRAVTGEEALCNEEDGKAVKAHLIVAGHAKSCSQKLHNMAAGVAVARRVSAFPPRFFLFLDADVSLHPAALSQMAAALVASPECIAATGYPVDLPPPGASAAAYAQAAFHLPLLVPMTIATRAAFVWGGCMMLRDADLGEHPFESRIQLRSTTTFRKNYGSTTLGNGTAPLPTVDGESDGFCAKAGSRFGACENGFDRMPIKEPSRSLRQGGMRLDILKKWVEGGYSDDQCLNNLCAATGRMAAAPTAVKLPQRLERRTEWRTFLNYLRRQLFVFHCYADAASRRHNRAMMSLGLAMGLQTAAAPALAVLCRLVNFLAASDSAPTSAAAAAASYASDPSGRTHDDRHVVSLSPSPHLTKNSSYSYSMWIQYWIQSVPMSTVALVSAWILAHVALVWFMHEATAMITQQCRNPISNVSLAGQASPSREAIQGPSSVAPGGGSRKGAAVSACGGNVTVGRDRCLKGLTTPEKKKLRGNADQPVDVMCTANDSQSIIMMSSSDKRANYPFYLSASTRSSQDLSRAACNIADVHEITDCFKITSIRTWAMTWFGIIVQSFISPFVLTYVALAPAKINWSGIEYTLKGGRVINVSRKT